MKVRSDFFCILPRCCTDLKDDDMEVTIVRGLSYNVPNPKTIDTYVRYEVPIPSSVSHFSKRPFQINFFYLL